MFRRLLIACALGIALLTSNAVAQEVPRPAKELQFSLPSGGKMKLSQFRGKVVLMAFLLTT